MNKLILTTMTTLIAATGAAPAQDAVNAFEPIDVFSLEHASDPRISPDGENVVYTRVSSDIMSDRFGRSIWWVTADGSTHRPLVQGEGTYYSPRWSPEGDRLAYVASEGGRSEIRVLYLDTLTTAVLATPQRGPGSLTWSPDGSMLAMTMFVPKSNTSRAPMPARPEGATWAAPPIVIDELSYRSDGAGYLDPGFSQLFVLDAVQGGTPRQVTTGDASVSGPIAFVPNSNAVIMSSNREEGWPLDPQESELYRIDLASGEFSRLTTRDGPDRGPVISPDGRRIAFTGYDDEKLGYMQSRLYVGDLRNGRISRVREIAGDLDRSLGSPTWSSDSDSIYVQFDDEGTGKVARVEMDGDVTMLATNVGGTTFGRPYGGGSFTLGGDGTIATVVTDPTRPADVAVVRDGETIKLTELNEDLLGTKTVPDARELWATSSADGQKIHAWVVRPPDFDPKKEYPLLLEIHGGPFSNYGPRFSGEVQLFASAGFITVYANPRGSTSYGADFGNEIHHNYPSQDYDDLMSVVDAVIASEPIDEDRLYVTGGSGGGVLTAWIVGKTDRFAGAVVAKPVINWTSFVLTADGYPFFTQYWFPSMPWEDPMHYWNRSPLSLVGNVSTPTMLLTGEADYRTPISETEQYYQALKLREIPTKMVRIPGASHGIASRPSRLVAKVSEVVSWFNEHGAQGEAGSKDQTENGED
ncbi:MAG: S9 family peptidase [Planctomycetota bacterium]